MLVVDDDRTVSEVVARYLQRAGFVTRIVHDGPAAIAAAEQELPDLVVLDLMLPGLDGFEVFRKLRALAPVPVVMLTALGDETDRLVGLELGADDYIRQAVLAPGAGAAGPVGAPARRRPGRSHRPGRPA